VVISLEPNGPEELKEDNIPKNEVVVLFGGNTVPDFMSISKESMVLSSLCIEFSKVVRKWKFLGGKIFHTVFKSNSKMANVFLISRLGHMARSC
ncbi:hypothetical protein H5410_027446, partial [Solanum commersonii]